MIELIAQSPYAVGLSLVACGVVVLLYVLTKRDLP